MKHFEKANNDDPTEIIKATQRAILHSMKKVIQDLKDELKSPGLTWEQLDYFLNSFEQRKPIILQTIMGKKDE